MPPLKQWAKLCALFALVACAFAASHSRDAKCSEIRLKNGLTLEGFRLDPTRGLTQRMVSQNEGNVGGPTMLVVNAGPKRYFVGNRIVLERVFEPSLARYETFTLKPIHTGNKKMVASLGAFTNVEPFDQAGHRTVSIRTNIGPEDIVQGITDINPKYIRLTGLTHDWDLAIATSSVPPTELDAILRNMTDPKNPDDRLQIARFYLQAAMHRQANAELESIIRDFPELKDRTEPIFEEVRQLQANELLAELRRRRAAGQDQLALEAIRRFPTDGMSVPVLRQVREMQTAYDDIHKKIDRIITLLGELQAGLKDQQQIDAVSPMRAAIADAIDEESLPKLDAFLKLVDDPMLKPEEKLAFAYSGWVLGSNNALRDLNEAIRIWNARVLVTEYLRAEDAKTRGEVLAKLKEVEGVGISRFQQMVPQLPLPLDTAGATPGKTTVIESFAERSETPVKYSILLPPEYSPERTYPLIVALRPAERTVDDMLVWWGGTEAEPGQSQRQGYIVIAPHYASDDARQYDYDVESHRIVRESIIDARKRFNIDSDRIFLSGHGMGGDATFDIGMSHPDLFAGIIPITGVSQNQCSQYWPNAKNLPMFIIGGQFDRNTFERNAEAGQIDRMMRLPDYDIIYCDYIGRGYESYYEEIHKLFEWMALCRRQKEPKEFDVRVLRPSENRFFWLEGQGFAFNANKRGKPNPVTFSAKATVGNTIHIKSGAKRHVLWLSPDIIDFDKRVVVKKGSTSKFNEFVEPKLETMLEDLRVRGDRQRIYSARLEID